MSKFKVSTKKNLIIYLIMPFLLLSIISVSAVTIFSAELQKSAEPAADSEIVSLKKTAAAKVASIRALLPSTDAQTELWNELNAYLAKQKIFPAESGFTIYYGNKGTNFDLEIIQPVTEPGKNHGRIKFKVLDPMEVASMVHKGPYQTLPAAYRAINKWIWKNHYKTGGPNQECYLRGAWNENDPQEYLTEIRVPIKKDKAVTYDSIKKKITKLARIKMKQNNITGMSLALVDDRKTIWTINFGYADLEHKIPVTANTLFRMGSNSKLFTATAVMQLAEQGKVDIDKPLQTYIPEFSMKTRFPEAGPVTIRSIMAHRSGIPGNYLPAIINSKYPYFTRVVLDIKDEYLAYPPNYITAYSNLAMTLLGVVVERVSGQKFNDYLTNNLLKPLEMNHSSFDLREDMKPLVSKGYNNGKPGIDDICPNIGPEGSLRSSANEMGHFLQMVLNNGVYNKHGIIKSATLNEMFALQPHPPLDLDGCGLSATGSMGLNWFLAEDPYLGKYGVHDGGTRLFFSRLMALRDSKLGIIVLTNSTNGAMVADEIALETIKDALKLKIGPPGDYYGKTETSSSKIELRPMKGFYASGAGLLTIVQEGKGFVMKVQRYPLIKFRLFAQPDGWFTVKPFLFGLFPVNIAGLANYSCVSMAEISGAKVLLANNNGIRSIIGEKIEYASLPAVWRKRCGKYYETGHNGLPSLNYRAELTIIQGMLTCYIKGKNGNGGSLILTPVSDTELLIRGLGRDMHETIRIINVNGTERLSYEGLVFKKVK